MVTREGALTVAQEGLHDPASPSTSSMGHRANGLLAKSGGDTPKLSNGTAGSQRIAAKLSELVSRFQGSSDVEAGLAELQEEVRHLRGMEEEITGYAEQALEEAERLKTENEDLRKSAEDATLDKQMSSAAAEAEKLKAAGDAHKRDLVQAKLVEREAELASVREKLWAANRETSNATRALNEARNATTARAREAEVLKQELARLRAGSNGSAAPAALDKGGEQPVQPESKAAAQQSTSPLASEHAEIAARLMAAGPGGVDIALLTAAAKALRDVSVLDKQFLRAREEKEALAQEVEHLNSTVFSKTFKAPSAWAEREVKYKMEKRDWDSKGRKLREQLRKVEAENAAYRASNKTAEFEARIEELKAVLEAKEAEKVAVERQLHELRIQGRSQDARARDDHEPVQGIIGDMEAHGIGHAAPMSGTPTASSRGSPNQSVRGSPPHASAASLPLTSHLLPANSVEEIIQDYDEKGVGIGAVRPGRRRGAPTRLRHGNGSLPGNRSSGSLVDGARSGDVRHLQSNFDGPYQGQQDSASTRSASYGSLHSQTLDGREAASQPLPEPGLHAAAEPTKGSDRSHGPEQDALHGRAETAALQASPRPQGLQSPPPRAQQKQWVPFGSPVEMASSATEDQDAEHPSSTAAVEHARASAPAGSAATANSEVVAATSSAPEVQGAALQHEGRGGVRRTSAADSHLGEGQQRHEQAADFSSTAAEQQSDPAAGSLQALPPDSWASGRSRLLAGDDGFSETSSSVGAILGGRGAPGATRSIGRDSSEDDGGDEWDPERRAALRADRAAVEAAWGAHVADNDVDSLRWKVAEAESQMQLHQAQVSKMQLALERADQENSRIEQQLLVAREAPGKLREAEAQRRAGAGSLAGLRDRMRSMSLLAPSVEAQAAERLQETLDKLKGSQHELAAIQRQRDGLARQLALVADKIGSGVIPDPADLAVPEHIAAAAGASVTASAGDGESKAAADPKSFGRPRLSSIGQVYAGLSDEEVEVMRLRDENEALMEPLVRAKVELAETQGDYLKTKRALLRAVEKQAHMAERLDNLKTAVGDKDLAGASSLLASPAKPGNPARPPAGVLTSLGEHDGF